MTAAGPALHTVLQQIDENTSARTDHQLRPAHALSWAEVTRLEECAASGSVLLELLEADAHIGGLAGAERLGDRNRSALTYAAAVLFEQVAAVAERCRGDSRP